MAVAYASVGNSPGATSTSIVITAPSGIQVGDLLVAYLCASRIAGTPTFSLSGWTAVNSTPNTTETNTVLQAFWKIADSGDAAAGTFTFTLSLSRANIGAMVRITGANATTPISGFASGGSNSNSTSLTISPGFTPTVGNCMYLLGLGLLGSSQNYSAYAMANSNPTWTERYDRVGNPALGIATSDVRTSSGDTGDFTATQSIADHFAGLAIGIAPALTANGNMLAVF
jgi:hypothetical protein